MICENCEKREGKIHLKYMKRNLCERCFCKLFEKRVRKTIRVNNLLQKEDRVGVALSGGKDSSVTLKILNKLSRRAPQSGLVAISVDEGTKFRKKSLELAEGLCEKLEVRHYIFSFEEEFGLTLPEIMERVKKLENPAPACSYCGILRRRLLNKKALELGLDKMATGHNLDDEAQTGMMNFIRGDLERIARGGAMVGIVGKEKFVPRIKPLQNCPEKEVLSYAKIKEINFHSTPCPYSEESFRSTTRKVIEKIEKEHPGSKFQLMSSLDNLRAILKKKVEKGKIKECKECGALTSKEICKVCQIREKLGF